ncbi:MAG: sugar phosphorylase [Acholeplasmataceae bacterium]
MTIRRIIQQLYPDQAESVHARILSLVEANRTNEKRPWVTEKDVMLITYGDSLTKAGEVPLRTLGRFLNERTKGLIDNVHILPMFPYSSDDGFSVIDYERIDEKLGTWDDIERLSKDHGLMFDAVINHISRSSAWFQGFLQGKKAYQDYFIACDPTLDYSDVVRPRALPLFYPYETADGTKHIWATFSQDQVDLNYRNPGVLLRILAILIGYARRGARFIRFDAIGFLWKEIGTPSIHLRQTHLLIKLMRRVLDLTVPGTIIVTETNVPHQQNVSYFGNGHDEAHMVYQFPLPPLVLFSFVSGSAGKLLEWADRLKETPLTEETTYFNFLASHDGIGMRPVEDILDEAEKKQLIEHVLANEGRISYRDNGDGTRSPYELNISYFDAVASHDDTKETRIRKFIASQVILLSVIGVPGIYVHSLIGSRNDLEGMRSSNIPRRINRAKLDYEAVTEELANEHSLRHAIFTRYRELLATRRRYPAFAPNAQQSVLFLDERIFSIIRNNEKTKQRILVLVNVSNECVTLTSEFRGTDIETGAPVLKRIELYPYRYRWIELEGGSP